MPSMVTRPVITSMANAIRLHWRRVVAVTWGWKQWKSATISTIGALRCGVGVVVLYNATLHDNGPPYLIFGEGIDNACQSKTAIRERTCNVPKRKSILDLELLGKRIYI